MSGDKFPPTFPPLTGNLHLETGLEALVAVDSWTDNAASLAAPISQVLRSERIKEYFELHLFLTGGGALCIADMRQNTQGFSQFCP